MTGKEKVTNAVDHKSGAIPLDIGATAVTGVHCSVVQGLRDYYGLEKKPVKIVEPMQLLGEIDEELKSILGIDTTDLWNPYNMYGFKNDNWKEFTMPWGQTVMVGGDFNTSEKNGAIFLYAQGDTKYPPSAMLPNGGYFFDAIVRQGEIDEDNLNPEDNLEEFKPITEEVLSYFKAKAKELENSPNYVVGNIGGTGIGDIALVPAPMLKEPKGIRDVEEWYVSTAIRQDFLHKVFQKQTEIALKNLEAVYSVAGNAFDAVFVCGTDFGTQAGTFCSPDTYKTLYMPYYKIINDWIHKNTSWKTFKHSCGAVESFYPLFIESGFDIINPVQWTATGMERRNLKEKYGKDLVLWGGGVDTQKTLPFLSKEEVRREVLETCEIFGDGGGFVFNAIHNIQAKTPIENIVAMAEALKEFNGKR